MISVKKGCFLLKFAKGYIYYVGYEHGVHFGLGNQEQLTRAVPKKLAAAFDQRIGLESVSEENPCAQSFPKSPSCKQSWEVQKILQYNMISYSVDKLKYVSLQAIYQIKRDFENSSKMQVSEFGKNRYLQVC